MPRAGWAVLAVVQASLLVFSGSHMADLARDWSGGPQSVQQVVARVKQTPGEVLVEEPGFALAAGKEVIVEPFQFALLARRGLWDPAPLIGAVARGRFDLVVLGDRLRLIPGLEAALASAYEREAVIGGWQVWRPRRPPVSGH